MRMSGRPATSPCATAAAVLPRSRLRTSGGAIVMTGTPRHAAAFGIPRDRPGPPPATPGFDPYFLNVLANWARPSHGLCLPCTILLTREGAAR
jgi:hypothetical protein